MAEEGPTPMDIDIPYDPYASAHAVLDAPGLLELILARTRDVDLRISLGGVARQWRALAADERARRAPARYQRPGWWEGELPVAKSQPKAVRCSVSSRQADLLPELPLWYVQSKWQRAAEQGDIMKCATDRVRLLVAAARHSQFDVLFWMLNLIVRGCADHPATAAAAADSSGVQRQGGSASNTVGINGSQAMQLLADAACEAAAGAGRLGVLDWLWPQLGSQQSQSTGNCMLAAAAEGRLDVLLWLHAQDAFTFSLWKTPAVCTAAARGGHVHVLAWLRVQREPFPMDATACRAAAGGGHVEALRFLRANGCPWDKGACQEAARWGRLDTLQWLRAQDPPCPWNLDSCLSATTCHSTHLVAVFDRHGVFDQGALQRAGELCAWLEEQRAALTEEQFEEDDFDGQFDQGDEFAFFQ